MLPFHLLATIAAAAVTPTGAPSADAISVRQTATGEFMTRYYPVGALKKGEQGKVAFELTVEPNGALTSCEVTGSSGFATLDRETCEFLSKYAKVSPTRTSDGREVRAVHKGYINWKLPAGARTAAIPAGTTKIATDRFGKPLDANKVICRRYARTGSKVGTVKQCMTRSEWALNDRSVRDQTQRIQDDGYINSERPRGQ